MWPIKTICKLFCFFLSNVLVAQISFSESSADQNINVSHGNKSFVGGISFFDFNNDGWDDLSFSSQDGFPLYFYQNNNGLLTPVTLNLVDNLNDTRQINWVDINNDGLPDISVLNKEPRNNFLWMNTNTEGNNWIKVTLEGNASNRMGIGSWIEISINGKKQYRYTINGEGYSSQN
jgi:hypothetical protein